MIHCKSTSGIGFLFENKWLYLAHWNFFTFHLKYNKFVKLKTNTNLPYTFKHGSNDVTTIEYGECYQQQIKGAQQLFSGQNITKENIT